MKLGRLAGAGLAGLLLSGCAIVADLGVSGIAEKIEANATTLNDAHTRAETAIIAMNVLRARDRWPTNYTTLSGIRSNPTMQLNGSATVAPFLSGLRRLPIGGSNATVSRLETANAEYSVNPFSNNDRSQSLLKPVSPDLLESYWRAGWPRETLMWLFVESVQFVGEPDRWKIKGDEFTPNASEGVKAHTARYLDIIRRAKSGEVDFGALPELTLDQRRCSTYDPVYLRETLGAGDVGFGDDLRRGGGMTETIKTVESLTGKTLILAPDTRSPSSEAYVAPDKFNRRLLLCDASEKRWGFIDHVSGRPIADIRTRSFDDMIYFLGQTLRSGDQEHPASAGGVILFQTYKERKGRQFAVRVEHAGQTYFIAPQAQVNDHDGARDITGNVLSLLNQLYLLAQSDTFLKAPEALLK